MTLLNFETRRTLMNRNARERFESEQLLPAYYKNSSKEIWLEIHFLILEAEEGS